jgi:hypothetical protein
MPGGFKKNIGLNRLVPSFLGSNAISVIDAVNENLAIANLAGLGGFNNGINGGGHLVFGKDDFDFDFGQKIDVVFAAAINLGMALLPSIPFDLGDSHALNAHVIQSLFDIVHPERFDNRFNLLHIFIGRIGTLNWNCTN